MEKLVVECNKNKLIALLISIMVTACNHDRVILTDLIYLKCAKAENKEAPKLSTLLKDIRYIALETNDSCLLNHPDNIILTDKYIVMDGGDKTECFVFDKKDGKYLRTIGMRDNEGPMGYTWATYPLYVRGNEVVLKAEYGDKYKFFSLNDGSLLRTVDGRIDGKR